MDNTLKKIKIYDSNFAHAKYSTDFQISKYIEWDRLKNYDVNEPCFYTDNFLIFKNGEIKNSYAWLLEPSSINNNIYEYIKNNNRNFQNVLTYDKELLDIGENFLFYPCGGCWIPPNEQIIYEKNKLISIIASSKNSTDGHKLRHEVIKIYRNHIDVYGRGYNPVKIKTEALKDYMFSIVIENTKKDYYFTEKLIDCFRTGTIPIYYGCPSISNFFDMSGVITFNNIKDLPHIIDNICNSKYYFDNLDAIKFNFEESKKYLISEDWIVNNLDIIKF
jgi:hypothetical protein